jgi:predicted nucleic acid-binding protein
LNVTLVDTNVLLDLLTGDPKWADWSIGQLDAAALRGPLAINDIVYTELSVRFATIEALDAVVAEMGISIAGMLRAALFLAGKVFQRYQASGGSRNGVLPDFFIGAHAAVLGCSLLSRDSGRYRTWFPTIELVTPRRWRCQRRHPVVYAVSPETWSLPVTARRLETFRSKAFRCRWTIRG